MDYLLLAFFHYFELLQHNGTFILLYRLSKLRIPVSPAINLVFDLIIAIILIHKFIEADCLLYFAAAFAFTAIPLMYKET